MFCSKCGAELIDGAAFCSKCGFQVANVQEEATVDTKKEAEETKDKGLLKGLNQAIKMGLSSDAAKKSGEALKAAGKVISEKAVDVKDAAMEMKDDIAEKLTELDRMLESSITEYNDTFTLMNDKGMQLFVERCRAVDTIDNVEYLINSIANHPKEFDTEFAEVNVLRQQFNDARVFAEREVQAARVAAGGAGAGLAAGASVAFMAPTAAMWIATTFGTASTGVAISTLSGAAADAAALAWLGGGALTAGGAGMAGGQALLALSGPIGWTIAGATLLTSIIIFSKKRAKLNKEKNSEIETVKRNTEAVREMDRQIKEILTETVEIQKNLLNNYKDCLKMFGKDYTGFSDSDKGQLGAMVNLTMALSKMYNRQVVQVIQEGSEE